jgi:hypothetical protein
VSTVCKTVSSWVVRSSSIVCAVLGASGRFVIPVGVFLVEGSALKSEVCEDSFEVWLGEVESGTGRMSSPSFPFLMVRLECGDLVVRVNSGEEFRGGVTGCIGASGERGRRCPRSRASEQTCT